MARPTEYTEEIFNELFEAIATSSFGVDDLVARDERYPSSTTFYRWLDENNTLREKYARARERQAEFMADEIIRIADDSRNDTQIDEKGNEIVNHDHIQRSKLRVDARKWKASKLAPKKYGDKLDVTTDGEKITNKAAIIKLPDGTELEI